MNANAIKSGIILGVITIIMSLLIYIVDYTLMVKWWYFLLVIPIIVAGLTAYFGISYRNENEGYMKFRQAYLYSIICIMVSFVVGTIWSILLFEVVDPELSDLLVDEAADNTEAMMSNFGAPEDQIDEQIEKQRSDMVDGFTVGGQIKNLFTSSLIFGAIMALISSLFIKKKEPQFEG